MKVLVTGASGFIGNRFIKRAVPNVLWLGSHFSHKKNGLYFLDITKRNSTLSFFKEHTTNVYGYDTESKNFVMGLRESLERDKEFPAAIDQYGNPTHVDDLVSTVCELLRKNKNGTYHVVGPDYLNRYDFALLAATVFGLNKS